MLIEHWWIKETMDTADMEAVYQRILEWLLPYFCNGLLTDCPDSQPTSGFGGLHDADIMTRRFQFAQNMGVGAGDPQNQYDTTTGRTMFHGTHCLNVGSIMKRGFDVTSDEQIAEYHGHPGVYLGNDLSEDSWVWYYATPFVLYGAEETCGRNDFVKKFMPRPNVRVVFEVLGTEPSVLEAMGKQNAKQETVCQADGLSLQALWVFIGKPFQTRGDRLGYYQLTGIEAWFRNPGDVEDESLLRISDRQRVIVNGGKAKDNPIEY